MPMRVTAVAAQPGVSSTVATNPTLRLGAQGPEVRRLQELLRAKGYTLTVDGDFGQGTRQVLRRFQLDEGLQPDGVAGPATWAKLTDTDLPPPPVRLPLPSVGIASVELPSSGIGFRTYNREGNDQFGTPGTIARLKQLGEAWAQVQPGHPFAVGDIAKRGGGRFPPHATHQRGADVDFRPISKDGVNRALRWDSPEYDRAKTRELIQLAKRLNPGLVVLFNDPVLIQEGLTRRASGHDNHFHFTMSGVRQ
jgi:penicillin-insensitive murein DD-endopeptidase